MYIHTLCVIEEVFVIVFLHLGRALQGCIGLHIEHLCARDAPTDTPLSIVGVPPQRNVQARL